MNDLFVDKIRNKDIRSIARLISMVENEDPTRIAILKGLYATAGKNHIVGITGPPGAGKSTLTDKIIIELRALEKTVAVLAVDPSSPFSGGALLGDRVRMQRHATDEGVFIRSLATRGFLGGLSQAVRESVRVFDSAGFDIIIVETVGVGQSEVDIVRCADTIVLVSVPGLGDDIQTIKAGIMEIGDIFVVNKADRDGAQRVVKEIRAMLEVAARDKGELRREESGEAGAFHHIASVASAHPNPELPPVLKTIAETGEGVNELVTEIQKHEQKLRTSGLFNQRRIENIEWELKDALYRSMLKGLKENETSELLSNLAGLINDKEIDFYEALERLVKAIGG